MKNKKLRGRFGKPLHNANIAINVVRLRKYYGIKQATLAKCIGVSTNMLSQYENGKEPFPERLITIIAAQLNCSESNLLQTSPSIVSIKN
jgi:transcriptional regulator with XRE-family HTH domain